MSSQDFLHTIIHDYAAFVVLVAGERTCSLSGLSYSCEIIAITHFHVRNSVIVATAHSFSPVIHIVLFFFFWWSLDVTGPAAT